MPSTVDLVIRVLADTSQASSAFTGLGGNVGKAIGIGTAGAAVAGAVAVTTKAAIDNESAMARIQASYNNADFAPGTAAYKTAVDEIMKQSQTLATNFDDVAGVHAQAARFIDDFGNRLPTEKLSEYTDTAIRLSKISTDNLSPEDLGARLDVFQKLSGETNFGQVGSAVAASSSIHNQGEGPMLDSAIALLQSGGALGVSQSQALGIGNYLTDLGSGGQRGGGSIGRLLLRQDASADDLLDPAVSAGKTKKARDSQEHIDDLQTSLKEAETSQAQMYGQHGLKTQYQRNPAALMESEDRIAKLNREIADSKADQITDAAVAAKTKKGELNVSEMAKTAGVDPTEYAELAKANPVEALLSFTRGLHELPEAERGAAERAAGISNTKDIQTIDLLQQRPDVVAQQIATAQNQLNNPTALNSMSDISLGTTASKVADIESLQHNAAATVGEPARQSLDSLLTSILNIGKASDDARGPVQQVADGLGNMAPAMITLAPLLYPFVSGAAGKIFGGGKAGPPAPGGPTSPADWTPEDLERIRNGGLGQKPGPASMLAGAGGLLAGGLGAAAAGGVAYLQIQDMKNSLDALNNARQSQGLAPINVNIGDVIAQGGSPDEVLQHVIAQITAAWHTAMTTTPVTGAVGGNIGGQSPQ